MKLRYFRIQGKPPLKDVAISFKQSDILSDRAFALHFVVGVNGSGKSQLLQTLTDVFLHLEQLQLPSYPVILAYDLGKDDQGRTIYFYNPGEEEPNSKAFLIQFEGVLENETDWDSLAYEDWEQSQSVKYKFRAFFKGDDLPGTATMPKFLPSALILYTSGAERPWHDVFAPKLESSFESVNQDDERPMGWTQADEIRYLLESAYRDERERRLQGDVRETSPWFETRQDLFADPADERVQSIGSFVTAEVLPFAVCAATMKQAADDFRTISTKGLSDEEFSLQCHADRIGIENGKETNFRALLNETNWLWPVTLSLTIDLTKIRERNLIEDLYSLAAMIIKEPVPVPRGQEVDSQLAVRQERTLVFDLRSAVKVKGKDAEAGDTVADQLIDIIGRQKGMENRSAFPVFAEMLRWHRIGSLRHMTFTLRRSDVEGVLLYDALSDGERMFMGRMSLLHFMQGQQDALIIFDEPETHFNDYWKRQIIDILDDNLRNATHEVLISTHSSIALTDVFAEEIVLLARKNGETIVLDVTSPTFGADPGEIMMYLFDAPDSTGKRAIEYLDKQLLWEWQPHELEKLEHLIRQVGPGYHRSELRTIWRNLRASQD